MMKNKLILLFVLLAFSQIEAQVTQTKPDQSTGISGVTISGTPTVGQVPTATGAGDATWQTPSGGGSTAFTTREDGTITTTSSTTWLPVTVNPLRGLDATVNNGFTYTVNLGAASDCQNCEIWFSNFNTGTTGTGIMLIDGFGTELVGSAATFSITAGLGATFQSVNTSGVTWTWRRKW